MARRLTVTLEGMDVPSHLNALVKKTYRHPQVHVLTEAQIMDVDGYVGNFVTTVKSAGRIRQIEHGVAILATGAEEHRPTEYLYGENEQVLTQLELEQEISQQSDRVGSVKSLVMIQCVGCRDAERNYCSRVCCGQALKNALNIKKLNPQIDIHILFRDMRSYGFKEDFYREAANQDIKFIRFTPEDKPEVSASGNGLKVLVSDPVLGQKIELEADLLALSAAVVPAAPSRELTRMFKVSQNPDGFFQEAHVKLRPVDFGADGVFLCGTAQYPKHINETLSQAYGAAGRAVCILSGDSVTASGSVCDVNESACISCGACISCCSYGAISFVDTPKGKKARVEPVLCKGDGLCNAKCPTSAIYLKHYTDDEIFAQIDGAFAE